MSGDRLDLDAMKRDLPRLCDALGVEPRRGAHACVFHGPERHKSLSVFQGEHGAWRWRCHTCNIGGDVFDALALRAGVSAAAILKELRAGDGRSTHGPPAAWPSKRRSPPEPARDLEAEAEETFICRERLQFDEGALTYLWEHRGIGADVACSWGLGCRDVRRDATGAVIGATWTMSVIRPEPPGVLVGVKTHADPPLPGRSKGGWLVKGACGLYPPPEPQRLAPGDTIILCEGELKGLAFLQAGMAATSPTTGASTAWGPDLTERFRGLRVIVDGDRDGGDAARGFVERATRALAGVALSVEVCG